MRQTPSLDSWLTFFGCVLVVAVLYWAQAVLVPVALALLITFVLTTPVTWLQRRIGRVPAVLSVVVLVFAAGAAAGWGLYREISSLAAELPGYRANIRQKVADVRRLGKGGSMEKIQETVDDIESEISKGESPRGSTDRPMVVESDQVSGLWGLPAWLGPVVEPLSTATFVTVLVIFMLLERQTLRDRLLNLVGRGHLTLTTRAFEEAGSRVSRQLLMQTLVSGIFGVCIFVGLHMIGVRYALVWAMTAAALRFVPYVGPIAAAALPIITSLASAPGWGQPLKVLALVIALELFTNVVLETVLYAGAAGVSQVALLISVAFWTWLWGLPGLLMAMPLTVCLVVLGRHVRGLEFIATLLADRPALSPELGFYQRLLARDEAEAAELVERHLKTGTSDTVYDDVLLPALNYVERDRLEERLSADEVDEVLNAVRDLMDDIPSAPSAPAVDDEPLLAVAASGHADELALRMLGRLLEGDSVALEVMPASLMASDVLTAVREGGFRVVCIADLPPSPPSKTRYLVKKLHAALPDIRILVGRWAPATLVDEDHEALRDAGATQVASTLLETRNHILGLIPEFTPAPREQEGADLQLIT